MPVNGKRYRYEVKGPDRIKAIDVGEENGSRACEPLELPGTILLVDVSETLTLLAVLHQAGCCQDEQYVHADEGEYSRENVVDENVGEARQGRGAALDQLGSGRTRACGVCDKSRRSAVEVTAALESCLQQRLDLRCLRSPDLEELLLRLQRSDPQVQADNETEDGVYGNHVAGRFQQSSSGGSKRRKCKGEADEDHYGIRDTGLQGKPPVQQVSRSSLSFSWRVEAGVQHGNGEAHHDSTGDGE